MGTISSVYVRDLAEKTSPEAEDCFVLGNKTAGRINLKNLVKAIANVMLPVGHILMTTRNVNPGTYLGGTWEAWGSGRVPTGVNADDTDYNASEKTGGAKTLNLAHSHTVNNHTHGLSAARAGVGRSSENINGISYANGGNPYGVVFDRFLNTAPSVIGGSWRALDTVPIYGSTDNDSPGTNSQLGYRDIRQPYITCYMWKRTA